MTNQYDVIVIGGGPGGYVAAIRAAQLKMKVALVEYQHLGGICLNWGCIPTKALLRSAEIYHLLHHLDEYGVSAKNIVFDAKKIVERSRNVASKLTQGIQSLMKKHKITVINGFGKLNGPGKVVVREGKDRDAKKIADLTASNIILATGARPRTLPGLEPDGKLIWTSREAMVPDAFPKSLLVIGSGAIGIEFASFYRNMGVEVTVVEAQDRILPVEDAEISKLAHKAFEAQGMKLLTKTTVTALEKGKNEVTATINGEKQTFERVLLAIGITGNTENLGLEGTGIKVEKNQIVVDEYNRTGENGVYAIGDVAGAPWLAHKASHEGIISVEHIAGLKPHAMNKAAIPGCTYSRPQIASVGLTEAKAKEQGHEIKVGRFPFLANGKAIAMGEPEGLVKTIFDAKTGELLGAHMIGAEVTEMIQGFTLGITMEATEAELMHTIFPHPTLSEMMHESVLDAYGKAIHF